jgi:multidrug transporter EmrE-like cation transporter
MIFKFLNTIDWIPLRFALTMATFDVIMMSIIKSYNIGYLRGIKWMIIPTISYAIQPWIFLNSLNYQSMIVMNLLWDVISDVLVTANGYFIFGEVLTRTQWIGVGLSIVSIYLLTYKDTELFSI